jgi:hypothetical protein
MIVSRALAKAALTINFGPLPTRKRCLTFVAYRVRRQPSFSTGSGAVRNRRRSTERARDLADALASPVAASRIVEAQAAAGAWARLCREGAGLKPHADYSRHHDCPDDALTAIGANGCRRAPPT